VPELTFTFTASELEDIRLSVRARRERVMALAKESDIVGNAEMVRLLFKLADRLDALDAKLATRERESLWQHVMSDGDCHTFWHRVTGKCCTLEGFNSPLEAAETLPDV
jgi:hypothetical protein